MSPITPSSAEPLVPASATEVMPATGSRTISRVVSGLLLLLCGCGIVVGGIATLFMVHTVGIGKLIGFVIVIGLAMVASGWTRIRK